MASLRDSITTGAEAGGAASGEAARRVTQLYRGARRAPMASIGGF
ncbi:MAG TPA: hypothetical protein VMI10_10065 [Terriglobales bacterium]|nr:hypothetical protein [Terriglobales bacterium]